MSEIIIGIVVGILSPVALRVVWLRAQNKLPKPQRFLSIDLTCSKCGHQGAFVNARGES